jgi:amylosucrase
LNTFYTGRFPGSFARGLPFQENPRTGDMRISGSAASLAGLEKALQEASPAEVDLSVRRLLLILAVILTVGGIPLIYLGDEIGTLNDYSFRQVPNKSKDSRWVHRPRADWQRIQRRHDPATVEGQIFMGLERLIDLRKSNPAFNGGDLQLIDTGNEALLGYVRRAEGQRVLVLGNFSEAQQSVPANVLRLYGLGNQFQDLLSGENLSPGDLLLGPYQFIALQPVPD